MPSRDENYEAARQAAEDVFREKVGVVMRTVVYTLSTIFGLLIIASSLNLANIILMVIGIIIGAGVVFVCIRQILWIHGLPE